MIALQLFLLSYTAFVGSTIIEVSPVQQEKVPFPILVTL